MVINIKDVTIQYNGQRVLEGINFSVHQGQLVALQGREQEKKRVFFQFLEGKIFSEKGIYQFQGKEVKTLTKAQLANLRKKEIVGTYHQGFLMNHLTVEKNFQMQLKYRGAYPTKWKKYSREILNMLDIEELSNQNILDLSLENLLKVKIGKALIINPQIILLEEKVIGEDASLCRKIVDTKGVTIMIATNDEEILQYADEAYIIENIHLKMVDKSIKKE